MPWTPRRADTSTGSFERLMTRSNSSATASMSHRRSAWHGDLRLAGGLVFIQAASINLFGVANSAGYGRS